MSNGSRGIEMTQRERAGYDAAALGEAFDKTQSREWQAGWRAFHADEARSETAKWV